MQLCFPDGGGLWPSLCKSEWLPEERYTLKTTAAEAE